SSSSSKIALSPNFSANGTSYSASVDSTTNHLRVYTTPEDAYAYVMINDIPTSSSYTTDDLTEGSNTIKILVIAADCEHTKTYTINVNRDKTLTEVYLSGLLAQTDDNKALTLSPAFSEKKLVYSANVNEKVNSVKFMPTVANSTYSVRIQGANKQPNMWTNTYTLKNGLNTFLIVVTDSTGLSSSNYTVNITKRGPVKATVSYQSLTINGKKVNSAAYLVNDNNYFKLRDIAYALSGSAKQFSVGWDEKNQIITVTSGKSYKATGDEMKKPTAPKKTPYLTNHRLSINGSIINDITAYNINDNNYYKLRDLAAKLNFSVSYDEKTHSVNITTTAGYNG
ncbi:MAG: cadherin-like beta sandwich domain-containing protein, partial [Clostridia bacterium]|nr:cadherin-like beta sandwich domain-containing protein [Clostridia bacterium]